MTDKSKAEPIASNVVYDDICKLLDIKDTHSTKLVITLEMGELVNIEHHFYASKEVNDE